jgi:hypothetical protein
MTRKFSIFSLMENNKFILPYKKPLNPQVQPKKLSERAVKNVANVLHIMLNDKK